MCSASWDYTNVFEQHVKSGPWIHLLRALPPTHCTTDKNNTPCHVKNFQVELLIINADSFEGERKQHLTARTFDEPVMKKVSMQNTNLFCSTLEWFCASAFLSCIVNRQMPFYIYFLTLRVLQISQYNFLSAKNLGAVEDFLSSIHPQHLKTQQTER